MKYLISAAALVVGAVAGNLLALPAQADVKDGVEAWQRGDYRGAVNHWRAPAIAGDADAQFNLAQAYKLGRGVTADLNQAEEWYRKAALQGHRQAIENYGLALFENGKRHQAVEWLEKAAAFGAPRAQYVLGTMLFNGDATEKDWVRAYALTIRAAAQGVPQASKAQAQMDGYISLTERQQGLELARTYERDAARPQLAAVVEPAPAPSGRPIGRADIPPSTAYQPSGPAPSAELAVKTPPPPPMVRVTTAPPPAKPAPVKPAPAAVKPAPVAASGPWKLQLGAFGDPANARKLGAQVASKFAGRSVTYVKSGNLTRVLVGPFATSGEASQACGSLSPCVPTRN